MKSAHEKIQACTKALGVAVEALNGLQEELTQAPAQSLLPSPEWLPLALVAQLYHSRTTKAFRVWAKRHQIEPKKLGQKLFYRLADIEAAIKQAPSTTPKKPAEETPRKAAAESAVLKLFRGK